MHYLGTLALMAILAQSHPDAHAAPSRPRSISIQCAANPQCVTDAAGESAARVRKPVVIFYIGGAGDKRAYLPLPEMLAGPFRNVLGAKKQIDDKMEVLVAKDLVRAVWLGYYEVYGDANIKENVLPFIESKATPIFIIGHSLGGWNGAHLSRILGKAGYNVQMLVTIDPVGKGAAVSAESEIYLKVPKVMAKYWINIRANAVDWNGSDVIADIGERWTVRKGPNINRVLDVNHADAGLMVSKEIKNGKTAADFVYEAIRKLTR